jgi:hypothetical protein
MTHRHVVPLLLIALVLCLVYVPYILSEYHDSRGLGFIKGDCYYYRAAIISLLEDGDLIISDDVPARKRLNGQLALGKDGRLDRLVPKHPILMPLVSLPFYAAFGSIGLLIFNVVQLIVLIGVVYLINTRFFDVATSVATALLFGAATLFLNYSYNYSPDVFSSLLLLTGVYFALCRRRALCAVFLGLSVFAKLTNLPLVGVVGLYVAFDVLRESRSRRAFGRLAGFGGVLALSLVPLLVTQELLYGSPWVNGYLRAVTETGLDDHVNKFNQPFVKGLLEILFHYEKGLVVTNPVLVLSAVGAFWVLRSPHRMQLLFLAALCLVQLAFFALYDEWAYSHFSNRFLMTTVALASVFAGLAIFEARQRWGRRPAVRAGV